MQPRVKVPKAVPVTPLPTNVQPGAIVYQTHMTRKMLRLGPDEMAFVLYACLGVRNFCLANPDLTVEEQRTAKERLFATPLLLKRAMRRYLARGFRGTHSAPLVMAFLSHTYYQSEAALALGPKLDGHPAFVKGAEPAYGDEMEGDYANTFGQLGDPDVPDEDLRRMVAVITRNHGREAAVIAKQAVADVRRGLREAHRAGTADRLAPNRASASVRGREPAGEGSGESAAPLRGPRSKPTVADGSGGASPAPEGTRRALHAGTADPSGPSSVLEARGPGVVPGQGRHPDGGRGHRDGGSEWRGQQPGSTGSGIAEPTDPFQGVDYL